MREKEIWLGCFLFLVLGGVFCLVFSVVSPRFCVVWCGNPLIAGFCRLGFLRVPEWYCRGAELLWMRVFSAASVSEEWLFWWIFECFCGVFVLFCLVLRGFLEFIAD